MSGLGDDPMESCGPCCDRCGAELRSGGGCPTDSCPGGDEPEDAFVGECARGCGRHARVGPWCRECIGAQERDDACDDEPEDALDAQPEYDDEDRGIVDE
jgi:hypothetical protein